MSFLSKFLGSVEASWPVVRNWTGSRRIVKFASCNALVFMTNSMGKWLH